jgi:hypothetical protein
MGPSPSLVAIATGSRSCAGFRLSDGSYPTTSASPCAFQSFPGEPRTPSAVNFFAIRWPDPVVRQPHSIVVPAFQIPVFSLAPGKNCRYTRFLPLPHPNRRSPHESFESHRSPCFQLAAGRLCNRLRQFLAPQVQASLCIGRPNQSPVRPGGGSALASQRPGRQQSPLFQVPPPRPPRRRP